jgi:AcrR family transcriptional regulator
VSQGGWLHYFPTKSEFLIEAMRYASEKIATKMLQTVDVTQLRQDPEARERILDEVWRVHTSPEFQAALELWIAARKDPELRDGLRKLERQVNSIIGTATDAALAGEAADPALMQLIDIGLATIRGFAMLAPVTPRATVERRWQAAKRYLLAAYDAYAADRL